MKNFRKLTVWQKGIEVVQMTYQLTKLLPINERFGLVSQMNRASVSIPSNIAEGCSRDSEKVFKNYLEISLGSAFELETQLEIVRLNYDDEKDQIVQLQIGINELQKMLSTLIVKLRKSIASN